MNTEHILIRSDLPLPQPSRGPGGLKPESALTKTLKSLGVGQCAIMPGGDKRTRQRLNSTATRLHKKTPKRFAVRDIDVEGSKRLAVWRTA